MQTDILRLANNVNEQYDNQYITSGNDINGQYFQTVPMDGSLTSRLMNTKIVRIYPGTACACVTGCKKLIFDVNTISKRDDIERKNENELPLFHVEEKTQCHLLCPPFEITFELFNANNLNELFSTSQITSMPTLVKHCCKDSYLILPAVFNYRANAINDKSIISRYDTRSFYRTYDYMGVNYYKIGKPYIPKETSCCKCFCNCISNIPCCFCFKLCLCDDNDEKCGCNCNCKRGEPCKSNFCCCCCCCCNGICCSTKGIILDKRIYIDIYNMSDQPVGKFAHYVDGAGCCKNALDFYEVYFPPDANELLRLALIAQIFYFIKFQQNYFGVLPGSRINLEQFIS